MTSAVVRVKRRITDEPFDKFVLNCKRLKTSHNLVGDSTDATAATVTATVATTADVAAATEQTNDTKTIVKLAATVTADYDLRAHLAKLRKGEAEELVQKVRKPDRVIKKLREQFKDDAQNQRFKVVNCFRSIDDTIVSTETIEGGTAENITIVDVIKEEATQAPTTANSNGMGTSSAAAADQSDSKFVYDLYIVQSGEQLTEIDISNYTIRPFDDLVYQANDDTLNDSDMDSEDSNDEAHWRNEYPDTDDDLSIGEEDMRRAVEDLNFNSDDDNLSSDDDDARHYVDDPVVHFMDESDDDENEYNYFKKHGQVRNHAAYYRPNRRNPRNRLASGEESDIDDVPSSNSSMASSVSPLASCDENSDDDDN